MSEYIKQRNNVQWQEAGLETMILNRAELIWHFVLKNLLDIITNCKTHVRYYPYHLYLQDL